MTGTALPTRWRTPCAALLAATVAGTLLVRCGPFGLLLFLTLGTVAGAELYRRMRSALRWDFLSVISGVFLLVYVLVPALLLSSERFNLLSTRLADPRLLQLYALILIGYLAILCGYWLLDELSPAAEAVAAPPVESPWDWITWIGLVFFAVGTLAFLFYAQIYGGLYGLYKAAENIRAGVTGHSQFVFLRRFMPFATLGAWLLLFKIYSSRTSLPVKLAATILLMAVPLTSSFATAGRLDVAFTVLPPFLATLQCHLRRARPAIFIVVSALCLAWFVYGDMVFTAVSYDMKMNPEMEFDRAVAFVAGDFRHPFISLATAVDNVPEAQPYRGLADLRLGIESLIPSRLLDRPYTSTVTAFNTYQIEGVQGSTVPPGLVAFAYYSAGVPGVLLWCALFGMTIRLVERMTLLLRRRAATLTVWSYAFLIALAHLLICADPRVILQNYFALYVAAGVLLIATARSNRQASRLITGRYSDTD